MDQKKESEEPLKHKSESAGVPEENDDGNRGDDREDGLRDKQEQKDNLVKIEPTKSKPTDVLSEDETTSVLLMLMVLLILVSSIIIYFACGYRTYRQEPDNNFITPKNLTEEPTIPASAPPTPKVQPQHSCTIQEVFELVLKEVAEKIRLKVNGSNTKDDCHDDKDSIQEEKGHFVIYIAVGLLLTSLAAALVDVYKAKGKPSKNKAPLTKRCSLADLTVLRHSRRESLRKDSIVDEQRGPIKLLGSRPLSEYRRCSFPVYIYPEVSYGRTSPRHQGSRKTSLDYYDNIYSYDFHHNRVVRLIRRC